MRTISIPIPHVPAKKKPGVSLKTLLITMAVIAAILLVASSLVPVKKSVVKSNDRVVTAPAFVGGAYSVECRKVALEGIPVVEVVVKGPPIALDISFTGPNGRTISSGCCKEKMSDDGNTATVYFRIDDFKPMSFGLLVEAFNPRRTIWEKKVTLPTS